MKKVVLIVVLILGGFLINTNFVGAKEVTYGVLLEGETTEKKSNGFDKYSVSCEGVFGDPNEPNDFAYYLNSAFEIMKIAGPVLMILMTIIDLFRLTSKDKQDIDAEFKKLGVKTIKRVIYAVILFLLPALITFVFGLIGLYGTCGVS